MKIQTSVMTGRNKRGDAVYENKEYHTAEDFTNLQAEVSAKDSEINQVTLIQTDPSETAEMLSARAERVAQKLDFKGERVPGIFKSSNALIVKVYRKERPVSSPLAEWDAVLQ